jgi:hypothetical protein
MCKDPAVVMLKEFGFQTIRLPRPDFGPLHVLTKRSGSRAVAMIGTIDQALAEIGVPPTISSSPRPDINGHASAQRDLSVGVKILGTLLKAFGVSVPSLEAAFTKTSRIEFEFTNVTCDSVNPVDLKRYVEERPVDLTSPMLEYIDGNREGLIVTATLKSPSFKVNSYRSDGKSAKIDVAALEGIVNASGKVEVKSEAENSISFYGPVPMHFGYMPKWIRFYKGVHGKIEVDLYHVDNGLVGLMGTSRPELSSSGRESLDDIATDPVRLLDLRDSIANS